MTPLSRLFQHRLISLCLAGAVLAHVSPVAAQELSTAERAAALRRVRALAACVGQQHEEMQGILRLIREAEAQRASATDRRVQVDADATLEALIARAATVEEAARACFSASPLPRPGTEVIVRGPDPDPAADAVAERGGTVRLVEEGTRLGAQLAVVRGEQVDGQGRLEPAPVRAAVRAIAPRLERCHDQHLQRGRLATHEVDVSFTVRGGRTTGATVERSTFADAATDRCLRSALQELRVAGTPRGGDATFGYRLRFGPAPEG